MANPLIDGKTCQVRASKLSNPGRGSIWMGDRFFDGPWCLQGVPKEQKLDQRKKESRTNKFSNEKSTSSFFFHPGKVNDKKILTGIRRQGESWPKLRRNGMEKCFLNHSILNKFNVLNVRGCLLKRLSIFGCLCDYFVKIMGTYFEMKFEPVITGSGVPIEMKLGVRSTRVEFEEMKNVIHLYVICRWPAVGHS